MKDPRNVIIRPIISEKSYTLLDQDKYTFEVHPKANKTEIRKAVEEAFNVQVKGVNIIKIPPKPKRQGWTSGRTAARKKAVVTLAPGFSIEFFEGPLS
ncbi:MAG: 50S ribosomal protein L23 [Actinomycetota bacterium]|nr:50S ribosomal protein L23 [Actinomycetota bacterium]